MRKKLLSFVVALIISTCAYAQELTVSAAVSLKEALSDIVRAYERETNHKVQLNFGATGQLLAQIREGAPVDLFIAAADAHMDHAEGQKLTDPATRKVIATNALVLIVPGDSKSPLAGFADLSRAEVTRVSIGEPKTVPAGMYASQVLRHLKLESPLKDKLIAGASVRQVLDYVERGEVDAGIVYTTDARQSGDKVRVIATAEPAWHDPIRYPAAVVSTSTHQNEAKAFLDYLGSEPAQKLLHDRGFAPPATQPVRR